MTKRQNNQAQIEAWTLDQLTKSAFFHRKLHEWKLLEVATVIEQVRGENLTWDNLQISEQAWNKIIHRGIKPVIVFAHPVVLQSVSSVTGYYRMLAMVSQKSMKRVGLSLDSYEVGKTVPGDQDALLIARHLNRLVSNLVELDEVINAREFDLWRGMAAGSQAQGSWQNNKGSIAEIAVEEIIRRRLQERGYVEGVEADHSKVHLGAGRFLVFADDPDVAIYENDAPQIAIEVKGGIDPAAVLERIGAAIKSLQRVRQENPSSVTVLILQDVSLTERAQADLSISSRSVSHLFGTRAILEDDVERERLFQILRI